MTKEEDVPLLTIILVVVCCLFTMVMIFRAIHRSGSDSMCYQWAGKPSVVYEGKCMVRTKDGGFRPAKKDEGK